MKAGTHTHDLEPFTHAHAFVGAGRQGRERALLWVSVITLVTMAVELATGWWTGSLALTADGWHMGTHALALGGAVLAYRWSRSAVARRGHDLGEPAARTVDLVGFAFGGWKIEVLAAYTSALALLGVAAWLAWQGVSALLDPRPVNFEEALVVAVIGLAVNLACAWVMLRGGRVGDARPADAGAGHAHADRGHVHHGHHGHDHHGHDHHGHAHHHHGHPAHGHDHNFNAAYLHVLTDALTSVLAIAALVGGAWFGLGWLDPAVALLGAAVIGRWSWGMLRGTAAALVDATEDPALAQRIRELIESDGDARLADLHVWQVGDQAWSAALAVVADDPLPAAAYRERLASEQRLKHVTVEVHGCPGALASPV